MRPVFITTRFCMEKALEHLSAISNPDHVNSGFGPRLSVTVNDEAVDFFEKITYQQDGCAIHVSIETP